MSCAHTRNSKGSFTPNATQKTRMNCPFASKAKRNRLLLQRTDWEMKLVLLIEEGKIERINSALCWLLTCTTGTWMPEHILLILSTGMVLKFTF